MLRASTPSDAYFCMNGVMWKWLIFTHIFSSIRFACNVMLRFNACINVRYSPARGQSKTHFILRMWWLLLLLLILPWVNINEMERCDLRNWIFEAGIEPPFCLFTCQHKKRKRIKIIIIWIFVGISNKRSFLISYV